MIRKGDVVSYNRYQKGNIVQGFLVIDDLGEKCVIEQISGSRMKLQMTAQKRDLIFLF